MEIRAVNAEHKFGQDALRKRLTVVEYALTRPQGQSPPNDRDKLQTNGSSSTFSTKDDGSLLE